MATKGIHARKKLLGDFSSHLFSICEYFSSSFFFFFCFYPGKWLAYGVLVSEQPLSAAVVVNDYLGPSSAGSSR